MDVRDYRLLSIYLLEFIVRLNNTRKLFHIADDIVFFEIFKTLIFLLLS